MEQYNNPDELTHYGVLGMRWGIRRGNAAGAYSRGVKKLKKYNKRAEKLKAKSDKLSYKSGKIYAKGKNDEKARELDAKARKLNYKSTKLTQKGKRLYKKMEHEFANVPTKDLNPEDVEYGRRYANIVLN